jgi:hypothetical protein
MAVLPMQPRQSVRQLMPAIRSRVGCSHTLLVYKMNSECLCISLWSPCRCAAVRSFFNNNYTIFSSLSSSLSCFLPVLIIIIQRQLILHKNQERFCNCVSALCAALANISAILISRCYTI